MAGTREKSCTGREATLYELARSNPDHRVIPLINGGAVIELTGDSPLNLKGWDLGAGTSVLRLYRQNIQRDDMERTAHFLTVSGPHDVYMRSYKKMSAKLRQFHYPFTFKERQAIARETGVLYGPGSFLKISSDGKNTRPWMLLSTSCPTLSRIVTDGRNYRSAEEQTEDLKLLQAYTALSRMFCLKRLSKLYYQTGNVNEIGFQYMDFPVHQADGERIYLASKGRIEKRNLFLGGRFGDVVYSVKPNAEPPAVPALICFMGDTETIGREIIPGVLKNCQGVVLEPRYQFRPD